MGEAYDSPREDNFSSVLPVAVGDVGRGAAPSFLIVKAFAVAVMIMLSFLLFCSCCHQAALHRAVSLASTMILCGIGQQLSCGAVLEAYRCSRPDNLTNYFLMAAARHNLPYL